ncbi:MAG: hypothetical protein ACMUJM_07440 [bacterium]
MNYLEYSNVSDGLYAYCRNRGYKGWDLYDGLNSKIFKRSPLYKSSLARLVWIQLFKMLPLNLRGAAFVPKEYNAKGLGLFAAGLIYKGRAGEAEEILTILKDMAHGDAYEMAWGYNFDWQARAFYVPENTPNIVTTVFVAHAFLDYYDNAGDDDALRVADAACQYIYNNCILYEDEERLCFSYIPGEKARVYNASMLGAALLGRVYSYTEDKGYLIKSEKAMRYGIEALNDDFSWPYGELPHHRFVDNFHTGFNLVSLKEWMEYTGKYLFEDELKGAYNYYQKTFFLNNGCPKYYNNALFPIDIHCCAQGIVTFLKLKNYDLDSIEKARNIADWAIYHMLDKKGFFYYQRRRFYMNKISYIRWAQAWMFYALAMLENS